MSTSIDVGAVTDAGTVRALNEDSVLAAPPLFAVADGMGGHAAGEIASALVLDVLRERVLDDAQPGDVIAAIESANQAILDHCARRPETAGMGTTLSGVCLGLVGGSPHWFVFNVGDSRVYRFADGGLSQVTTDHSEVQELITLGQLTRQEARHHPRRNVVTRSLGTDPAPTPDIWVRPAAAGDVFLICSDGLPLEVEESDMRSVLAAHSADPQQVADTLLAMALAAGARDNVSAVVVCLPANAVAAVESAAVTAPRSALKRARP